MWKVLTALLLLISPATATLGMDGPAAALEKNSMVTTNPATRNENATWHVAQHRGDRAPNSPSVIQSAPEDLTQYRGRDGETFEFIVTGTLNGAVWGDGTYTDDSQLAAAAVHAGLLKIGETGRIRVTLLPGQQSYSGATRNQVTSNPYQQWDGSFRFVGSAAVLEPTQQSAAPVSNVQSEVSSASDSPTVTLPPSSTLTEFRGRNGETFTFEVQGELGSNVWGDGVYSDDSVLAVAAVHAGQLKPGEAGRVRVTILPGERSYTGTTRNQVTSNSYSDWQGSFRFEGRAVVTQSVQQSAVRQGAGPPPIVKRQEQADMAAPPSRETSQGFTPDIFANAKLLATLVQGVGVDRTDANLAYLYGFVPRFSEHCNGWTGDEAEIQAVKRMLEAGYQRMITALTADPLAGMSNGVSFTAQSVMGQADADKFVDLFGCKGVVSDGFVEGVRNTLPPKPSPSFATETESESIFVKTCRQGRLSGTQCQCLADVGSGVIPRIHEGPYSRDVIPIIVTRNPIVGRALMRECLIWDY
jgi:hypothetical protein